MATAIIDKPVNAVLIGKVHYVGAPPLESVGELVIFDKDILGVTFPVSEDVAEILRHAKPSGPLDPADKEIVDAHIEYVVKEQFIEVVMDVVQEIHMVYHFEQYANTPEAKARIEQGEEVTDLFTEFLTQNEDKDYTANWVQAYGLIDKGGVHYRVYYVFPQGNIHGGHVIEFMSRQPPFHIEADRRNSLI